MHEQFSRSEKLLGQQAIKALAAAKVAVFGIGGVGSHAAEALARAGVGSLDLFDYDEVCASNINRQLIATHSTLGRAKVGVMKARILDINPDANVLAHKCAYTQANAQDFDLKKYDYIVDAIDMVSAKLVLIEEAGRAGVPIISCMGAGNKLDPTRFEVADIYETTQCPLARVMRRELRQRGIDKLKVVYSKEPPIKPIGASGGDEGTREVPGSVPFVPPVAGFILAGEVIKDILDLG